MNQYKQLGWIDINSWDKSMLTVGMNQYQQLPLVKLIIKLSVNLSLKQVHLIILKKAGA